MGRGELGDDRKGSIIRQQLNTTKGCLPYLHSLDSDMNSSLTIQPKYPLFFFEAAAAIYFFFA